MPVFISYRHTERLYAFILNERLQLEGIDTCLELFDAEAHQTTSDVYGIFQHNLTSCSHMIVVLGDAASNDTWWLPFGLGMASAHNRRIALYQSTEVPPPEYLQKWPVLGCRDQIDLFVGAYHDEKTFSGLGGAEDHMVSADVFHTDLKARIRRGY
ncbi:molecular chaperone Tir [Pseudomonas sp. SDI]|uniref:toll/interleukin-1 receptor domain-containing protein n=1 Tax=Pseudomonas sp. SDI TaxID=2170734 RepID=UPI000DE78394|nr:toll/interleukin-1 receptor domain-containing protein [Pseudomonas sp. SDI]PWB33015.1 molecular chaperone Tir [Pseudomonas sp. SDI]